MNLIKILGYLFFCTLISSCNKTIETKKWAKNKTIKTSKQLKEEDKFLIRENGVLNLFLNDSLPKYTIIKSIKIVEEGIEEPVINLIENNKQILQISLKYDDKKQKQINKIGEFLIKSNVFKTKENIGVDSTIKDFIKAYPKFSIWYSYISDNFVIESKNSKIQFILDNKGYIGNKDLMESDAVKLKLEDFSPNTKIKAIRIF